MTVTVTDAVDNSLREVISILVKRAGLDGVVLTIADMEAMQASGGELVNWISPTDGSLHLVWSEGARQ